MNVAVVGLGKLGLPMAALFASRGHQVVGYETHEPRVLETNDRTDPLGEPGLAEILAGLPAGALIATGEPALVAEADVIFLVVPTPSDSDGAFSPEFLIEALTCIGPYLKDRWRTVVVTSTVMPGTMDEIAMCVETVTGLRVGTEIGLAYSPEFIALGSVLADMASPDFILIGSRDARSAEDVRNVLDPVIGASTPLFSTSFINAELAKLALNAYVTTKISFANTLAEVCELLPGADAREVVGIIGTDRRVGRRYLTPGGPAAGPCFPRDLVAFARLATTCGVSPDLARAAIAVNDRVTSRVVELLSPYSSVAILGMAYKPGTSVTDKSLGIRVADRMLRAGKEIIQHDPMVPAGSWRGAQPAVDWAEAVLVALPLPEYETLDYSERFVVDVWGLLEPGPNVYRLGVGR